MEATESTELASVDIEANLKRYLADREDIARYASFDYCFNYFRWFYAEGHLGELASADNLQLSCLQLGFFLASWGMFRGRSQLLQRSVKHYVAVLEAISEADKRLWEVDVDGYDDEAIGLILSGAQKIRNSFPHPARDVLVTKIMLGVFGCVPAFDRYFKDGFGSQTFGAKALRRIGAFYESRSGVIDRYRVPTIDFNTGGASAIRYTGAKVIDMIFFIEGMKKGVTPGE